MELGRFGSDPDAPEPETEEELAEMLLAWAEDPEDQDAQIIPFPQKKDDEP